MKKKTLDMAKRLASLLLVFAMCFSIIPQFATPAYAAGGLDYREVWLISQPGYWIWALSDPNTGELKEVYVANMVAKGESTGDRRCLKCKRVTIDGQVYWVVDNAETQNRYNNSPIADVVNKGTIDPMNAVQPNDATPYKDIGYVKMVSHFNNRTVTDIKDWEGVDFEYVSNSQKPFDPNTITADNEDTTYWAGNKAGQEYPWVTPGKDAWVQHINGRNGLPTVGDPTSYAPSFLDIRPVPHFEPEETIYYAQIAMLETDIARSVQAAGPSAIEGLKGFNLSNNAQFLFRSERPVPPPESGNLIIRKVDATTNQVLPNATFKIEQVDGGYVNTIYTDVKGEAILDGREIPTGSYLVYEYNTPEGYVGETQPQAFSWVNKQREDITLTFTNYPEGGLDIYKYDSETNTALKGASFDVFKDGAKITTLITGDDGHAKIMGLKKGYYQVVEQDPPSGYLADKKSYEVYVDPEDTNGGAIRYINVPNTKKPGLRIFKLDDGAGIPLEGFSFEITKDSAPYTTGTTDANGEIILKNLEPGTYNVHESGGPDEYIIDAPDQEIEITGNETEIQTLTFRNKKKAGFWILKLDADTGKPIANVTFSLSRDGNEIYRFNTDETGYVKLENVEPGTYVVKEENVPPQYIKSDESFIIEIGRDSVDPTVYTVTNVPKKDLTLRKIDENTGEVMKGVAFKIYKDNNYIGCQETDDNGEIVIPYADPGTYRFEEYRTLDGYELNTTPINVEQTTERSIIVTASNVIRKNLIIRKEDAKTKEPLEGVIFEIFRDNESLGEYETNEKGEIVIKYAPPGSYRAVERYTLAEYILNEESKTIEHTLDKESVLYFTNTHRPGLGIRKLDSVTGNPLKGAKFQIWSAPQKSDGGMNDLGYFFTDDDGYIKLSTETDKYLKEGWYRVTEVAAPTGYNINEPSTQEVYLTDGNYEELTFLDTPKSALVIWKYDSVTGEAVPGAVFQVRYLAGGSGTGGRVLGPFTTGINGSVSVTDLDPGTYVVEEIAAANGYVIDTAPQNVIISGEEQNVVEVHFGNSPYGDLLIKKLDAITKQPLEGVKFKVTTSDGNVVGESNGEFYTDAEGSILVDGIEPYTSLVISEMETIRGYVLNSTPQTIETQPGKTVVLSFINQPRGTLIVEKYDKVTGKPLSGVEFKIEPSDGKLLVDNEGLTSGNGLYRTDGIGQIILSGLTPGSYIVTETKPLDGYSMDDVESQNIVIANGGTHTIRFYNVPDGNLIIHKVDSVTGSPLAGVEFKIESVSNSGFEPITEVTDGSGLITKSRLPTGTYKVTETRTLPGYELDDIAQTAFVEPGTTKELTFRNRPLGGLLIKKKDSVTNEPISGVTFKIAHSDGTVVGTGNGEFITDSGGFISIPDLKAGTYLVQEIKAKQGYVLDDSVKTIEIKDHQTYNLEFYNQPYGKIIINKIDSSTKKPLEGVEFEIKNSAGELIGDYPLPETTGGSSSTGQISSNGKLLTDSNGQITVNSVKPGTYVITETATIPGYIIDSTPRSLIVGPGDTQTLTIGNAPKGSLLIRKIDSVTKEPLEGVKFKVTNSNGNNVDDNEGTTSSNGVFTTDENGEIYIGKLSPDTYSITEIETIPGYVRNAETQTVRVNSNDGQVLTFTNPPKGSLTVRKIDSVTKEPLAGVKFQIVAADGSLISGNEGATSTNGIYTTDINGEINLSKLNPTTYIVTETETIPGYVMDAQPQTAVVNANTAVVLTFTNTPQGGIVIKKMDSVSREPLSDVTFKVTTTDGAIVGTNNGEFTTDSEGFITISKLHPGTYIVQEISTKYGYVLDNTPKTIEVKDHQTYTLDVYNQPYGGLIIHKIDSVTKKPLQGVKFKITTSDGQLVPDNDGLTSSNGRYITNAEGEIVLNNVKPGTYVVTETKTIDGYSIDAEPQTVVVNPADIQTLTFTNSPKGSLIVRKIDSVTKLPLVGVKFKITTSDGNLVANEEGAISSNGIFTTDENGEIAINKLNPGTYVVTETETLPGYVMDAPPQTVVVNSNDTQVLTFTNTPYGNLVIRKFDLVSKEPLSDVTFRVTTTDGAVVGTSDGEYVTDSNGYINIPKLAPATYIVQEARAKKGYVLDNTPKTIEIKDSQTYNLEFYNQPYGGLIVRKVDSVTKEPMQGVEFNITTADGQLVMDNDGLTSFNGRYVTNEDGEIVLNSVKPGTYIVTESKTLDGYVMDAEPQTVVVDAADIQTLTFTNAPKGSLIVRLIDKVTKEPMEGAEFQIVTSSGELVNNTDGATSHNGIYTTNENGEIALGNVHPDTYVVTQTSTIPGYIMDSRPQTVVINKNDTQVLTFTNTPEGDLVIKKMDSVTREALSDVLFKITTIDGVAVGTSNGEYRTDANGYIVLNDLAPGSYIVQELQAKSGYVLDDTPKIITVKDHQTYTMEIYNQPKGSLIVRIIDAQTREPLANAEFEIRTADGTLISNDEGLIGSNGIFVSDENGRIVVNNLMPGTYTVTQIKTIDGYVMDSRPQTVVIAEDETQTLTFTNTRMGSLVVTKIDSVTRKPLEGVTFQVKGHDEYGYPSDNYITDVNGQFSLENIPNGVYTVQEMQTIPGYKLDSTVQTVTIEAGKQKTLTFTNDPLGGLLIKKMDSVTREPLSDVTFKITRPDGTIVGNSNGEYTTDSTGHISITDLEPGTYIVEEIQTRSGYVLDRSVKTVVIKDHETYTLEFYNKPKEGLVIRKIDSVTKNPLQGVEFQVKTSDGSNILTDEGLISSNGLYTTNENGEIVLEKLTPGTYVVTETKTIDGYRMDATPQSVVIGEGDTQTLTFTNTPLGGLLIKKMNAVTKEPLADVIFLISRPDGSTVGNSNGEYHTDEYGYISITNLNPGTYVVKEVQAKKGFVLDDTPKVIEIKDNKTYTLEVFNQPKSGLIVRKIDSKSREPLEGVQFKITTASGELVSTNEGLTSSNGLYTTDANGEIVLEKLMPGTYIVSETKTIDGYMMDAAPQTVVITEGDIQTLTFTNTPGASLVIKKIDSKTRKPIAGVTFDVKGLASIDYPNGSYTTDINGMIRLDGIPTGAYTVVETKAKEGYQLDNTPQTIQINAGETKELTFANDPLSGLTVTVKDANTKEPLAGIVVKITTIDGQIVGNSNGEFTTDNNGTIVINQIASGSYIIQEVRTLNGYVLDDTPKTIQINDLQNYLVEIFNHREGGLLIRKVDSATREPLAGVEFKITSATGEYVDTNDGFTSYNGIYVTDENGEIMLSRLDSGTYIVTENKTIDGYIMDAAPQTVVVGTNDTQVLTFTNTRQGGLVIRKIDEDTRQPLKNALFSIKKANGEVVNARAETDINGLITVDNLDPGAYIIAEEKAPEGYVLQDAPMTVELAKGKPTEVTFTNRQNYGIQIRAIVKGTHDPIDGCKFEIKSITGEFIGSYVTDSSGLVNVSVSEGIYVVTQITGPEGFKIDNTPQNVIVKAGTLSTVTFENDILAGIRIKLVDAISKVGIYNVRFLVKTEGNQVIGEYTTDQDGYIELNNLLTNGQKMLKYKVEQISSVAGYEVNTIINTLVVNVGEITELVVENIPILGQIQITTKAGQDNIVANQVKGTVLEGAIYEITDSQTGRVIDTITSDARGIAASNPIPLGTYYVQQVQAPRFYQINNQKVEVKLKVKGDVIRVEVYNDASNLKTTIQQSGNYTVDAGSNMRYDIFNIANTSNVPVDKFFWHDRIPTDAVRVASITTGTYNARVWYKITYKTNKNDYRTLADNLLSTSNYAYKVDSASLGLAADEYVTDIRYEFTSTAPAGFKMTAKATIYVHVPSNIPPNYTIINRADVGGSYQGEWDSAACSWTTKVNTNKPTVTVTPPTVIVPTPPPYKLPQTGY